MCVCFWGFSCIDKKHQTKNMNDLFQDNWFEILAFLFLNEELLEEKSKQKSKIGHLVRSCIRERECMHVYFFPKNLATPLAQIKDYTFAKLDKF